jgi:hypothetical protein
VLGGLAIAGLALQRTPAPPPAPRVAPSPVKAPDLSVADRVARVQKLVADVPCTWAGARATVEGAPIVLSGGTGNLDAVNDRLGAGSASTGKVDATQLRGVNVTQCGTIDALRPYRATGVAQGAGMLAMSALDVPLGNGGRGCPGGATADLTMTKYDAQSEFALLVLQADGRLLQIAGSRAEFDARARQAPETFSVGADGTRHVALCYTQPGSAAAFLVESKGAIDLGLKTGVSGLPPADFSSRLADQGSRQGMRVFAEWVHVTPPQPGGARLDAAFPGTPPSAEGGMPVTAMPRARRPLPVNLGRARAAIDSAEANRLELARIQALGRKDEAAPAPEAAACRAFDGKWRDVGNLGRDACVAQAIKGRCKVTSATSGKQAFRRWGDRIQERRGNRWRSIATDTGC